MSGVIIQSKRTSEVVSVSEYVLTLSQEEAECLLALIYCQLSSPNASPLTELRNQLNSMVLYWETMRGSTDGLHALALKYAKFVKG